MSKFRFRLQKVLEFREQEERSAEDILREKQIAVQTVERNIEEIGRRRTTIMGADVSTLEARISLQSALNRLDDEQRAEFTLLGLLQQEEQEAKEVWIARRQARKALDLLRDKAKAEWQLAEDKRAQDALDEWTITQFVA